MTIIHLNSMAKTLKMLWINATNRLNASQALAIERYQSLGLTQEMLLHVEELMRINFLFYLPCCKNMK